MNPKKSNSSYFETLSPAPARGRLVECERVLMAYSTFDNFLGDPAGIERYYQNARLYYGPERFPRAAFDALVEQLRYVAEQRPWLKDRLWRANPKEDTVVIQTAVKSHGRRLAVVRWGVLLSQWRSRLTEIAAPLLALRNDRQRESEIASTATAAEWRVREEERRRSFLDEDLAIQQRHHFFSELRKDARLRAAAAFLLLRYLATDSVAGILRGDDADLLLDLLIHLRQAPRDLFPAGISATGLASHLKSLVPKQADLLADTELFPRELRATPRGTLVPTNSSGRLAYHFVRLPRKFHGIFKGIPLGECIGGNVQSLESLTPERWISVAVEGARLYHLERISIAREQIHEAEQTYLGFVQLTPMTERRTGEVYASIDFGASGLRTRIGMEDPATKRRVTYPLWKLWLREFASAMPSDWRGFVVSESNALNNAGVMDSVRMSPPYLQGRTYPANRFICSDKKANTIVGLLPRHKYARDYGGRVIFDGATKDARTLTVLALTPPADDEKPTQLLAKLRSSDPVVRWRNALRLLQSGESEVAAAILLSRALRNTCRSRYLRAALILTGRWVENKYTMELWTETLTQLQRWCLAELQAQGKIPFGTEIRHCFDVLSTKGRTAFVRQQAARALQLMNFPTTSFPSAKGSIGHAVIAPFSEWISRLRRSNDRVPR